MAGIKKITDGNYHKWRAQRLRVLKRDNYTCAYCGGPGNEADHIIPRVRGGDDSLENLVCACRECNNKKGKKDISVFSGTSDTPPVSRSYPSPMTLTTVPAGPFQGQN